MSRLQHFALKLIFSAIVALCLAQHVFALGPSSSTHTLASSHDPASLQQFREVLVSAGVVIKNLERNAMAFKDEPSLAMLQLLDRNIKDLQLLQESIPPHADFLSTRNGISNTIQKYKAVIQGRIPPSVVVKPKMEPF